MTVQDLIEELENLNPESKVTIMIQPNYPLEYDINGVVSSKEYAEGECEDDEEKVVITTGEQLGYGIPAAWEVY